MEVTKVYFGQKVTAWRSEFAHPAYPWCLRIEGPGGTWTFGGIPNCCETSRQALRRGWWRAKWISEGTFDNRYKYK